MLEGCLVNFCLSRIRLRGTGDLVSNDISTLVAATRSYNNSNLIHNRLTKSRDTRAY